MALAQVQDARIDIASIKQHPWFVKPLPPKYANALATMQQAQAAIDEQAQHAAALSGDRDRKLQVSPGKTDCQSLLQLKQ